ncbi:MAG: BACON domain-containing protein [candidate division Zixibacteria bacterium]|nr:BACON domain-containing protein [candidate division Zixibacteria bacterium]
MQRKYAVLTLFLLALMAVGEVQAGNVIIRTEANPELAPGYIKKNQDFTLDFYMTQSSGSTCFGFSATYGLYSPDASITSIVHRNIGGDPAQIPDGSILLMNGFQKAAVPGDSIFWNASNNFRLDSWDGVLPDTINHTTIALPLTPPLPGWPSEGIEKLHMQMGLRIEEDGVFCIDSIAHANPTYDWLWSPPQSPEYGGPYCWNVADNVPPVIDVVPTSLNFSALAGSSGPGPQVLTIDNVGAGTLSWTATWDSSWLLVQPAFGSVTNIPSTVQITVNISGMPSGVYKDTIVVSDPAAGNSPIKVPVMLTLTEPPPVIAINPTQFYFSAIADSANPDDQVLHVANVGAGVLNWTASNSSTWLSLFPTSGVDDGDVTLSVDITGMSFGIYYDTVVVSDPAATNDPQKAVVRLEIASDLPVLAVDSPSIFIIVEIPPGSPANRQFTIYNDGAGSMTYYLEENSPRVLYMTPSSGTVPQTVDLEFKILNGDPPEDFYDTIWVYSDEAVNSPIPVELHFHVVSEAAEFFISRDSLYAEFYECHQGIDFVEPPGPAFIVYNAGGDALNWEITHYPEWMVPNTMTGSHGTQVRCDVGYEGYPQGLYADSIVLYAINAINNPFSLPVYMNILPTDTDPTIWVGNTFYEMACQENKTGKIKYLSVDNENPGCMEWELDETVSWVGSTIVTPDSISYPWLIEFIPNGYGIVMGEYNDSCFILSPDATNTPVKIGFKLWVWKLHGDVNYDGLINLIDLLDLIYFLYMGSGVSPIPEMIVGDCNCDYRVNLIDLQLIIQYLYMGGPPLCGNPY